MFNDEAPRQFVAPVPYFTTQADTVTELEKERDALIASLPKLKGGARSRADHSIRLLEREIRAALDMEEVGRRNAERVRERERQQVGADSPFARQTLAEPVVSTVAGVKAVVGRAPAQAGPTVRAYAAQGKKAVEDRGMFFGPTILVR